RADRSPQQGPREGRRVRGDDAGVAGGERGDPSGPGAGARPAAGGARAPGRGQSRHTIVPAYRPSTLLAPAMREAVAAVAGGEAAAWYLQLLPGTKKAEAKQEAAEAPKPAVGALLALDPFIANLGDEDGKRYLKASLQVEFFGTRVPDEFTARQAQVRDLLRSEER